jgi:hypothetical protein
VNARRPPVPMSTPPPTRRLRLSGMPLSGSLIGHVGTLVRAAGRLRCCPPKHLSDIAERPLRHDSVRKGDTAHHPVGVRLALPGPVAGSVDTAPGRDAERAFDRLNPRLRIACRPAQQLRAPSGPGPGGRPRARGPGGRPRQPPERPPPGHLAGRPGPPGRRRHPSRPYPTHPQPARPRAGRPRTLTNYFPRK